MNIADIGSEAVAARYFAGRSDGAMPIGRMNFVRALIGAVQR